MLQLTGTISDREMTDQVLDSMDLELSLIHISEPTRPY
jgi:translation elongation factor EF-4